MRIGIFAGEALDASGGIDALVAAAQQAADDGFASFWVPNIFSGDALVALAVVAREVPGIGLGTAVVPTYPRHPAALAQQAQTVNAISGGRLTLGIGLSHQIVIENMFGYSFDKPLRHMREYLSVLLPLVREGNVSFTGETVSAHVPLTVHGATPLPVLVAALGPKMLELAGTVADGTVTWMTGAKTLAGHITPAITAAAEAAGRPAPRIAAGLPICVTDDEAAARQRAAQVFAIYGTLPSYRAMLDREGCAGPEDLAIVGDEAQVRERLEEVAAAGTTELAAVSFSTGEDAARTRALLKELAAAASPA
jgi:5,10-methylenetetrahydromethanopterin reductase